MFSRWDTLGVVVVGAAAEIAVFFYILFCSDIISRNKSMLRFVGGDLTDRYDARRRR